MIAKVFLKERAVRLETWLSLTLSVNLIFLQQDKSPALCAILYPAEADSDILANLPQQ